MKRNSKGKIKYTVKEKEKKEYSNELKKKRMSANGRKRRKS